MTHDESGDEHALGISPESLHQVANKAIASGFTNWWKGLDSGRRTAWTLLVAAGAAGPGGLGVLAITKILYGQKLPTSQQLTAVLWLIVLTAPLVAAAVAFFLLAGKIQGFGPFIGAAICGLVAAGLVGGSAPKKLGDVYCYNDGTVREHECREFRVQGLVSEVTAEQTSDPFVILRFLYAYTVDARGDVIALAGLVAGGSIGYLVRRSNEPV